MVSLFVMVQLRAGIVCEICERRVIELEAIEEIYHVFIIIELLQSVIVILHLGTTEPGLLTLTLLGYR